MSVGVMKNSPDRKIRLVGWLAAMLVIVAFWVAVVILITLVH